MATTGMRMCDLETAGRLQPESSVESESDSGLVDSDQIPVFQGFKIDSNLFFKIHQMIR